MCGGESRPGCHRVREPTCLLRFVVFVLVDEAGIQIICSICISFDCVTSVLCQGERPVEDDINFPVAAEAKIGTLICIDITSKIVIVDSSQLLISMRDGKTNATRFSTFVSNNSYTTK